MLDGYGCVGPGTPGPEGVSPHRAPARVCAVFGDVIDKATVDRVKDLNGDTLGTDAIVDLYIETTTPYTAASDNANHVKEIGAAKTPTFGEINLKGPETEGTSTVGLTFTFKRRDTRAEVEIPWMQFTLFDFDQAKADTSIESGRKNADGSWYLKPEGVKGQEVPPPLPRHRPPHHTTPHHTTPHHHTRRRPTTTIRAHGLRDPNRSARQSLDSLIMRCQAAAGISVPFQPR